MNYRRERKEKMTGDKIFTSRLFTMWHTGWTQMKYFFLNNNNNKQISPGVVMQLKVELQLVVNRLSMQRKSNSLLQISICFK